METGHHEIYEAITLEAQLRRVRQAELEARISKLEVTVMKQVGQIRALTVRIRKLETVL